MKTDRGLRSLKKEELPNPPFYTNSWALVIGFNKYEDEKIPKLRFAENDATAMASLLPELGFPKENIRLVLASHGPFTPTDLHHLLDEIDRKCTVDDRFLFYIAGHGMTVELHGKRSGYLLTPGSQLDEAWVHGGTQQRKPQEALEMNILLRTVDGFNAKHKLLILDACFSGFVNTSRNVAPAQQATPALLQRWTSNPTTEYFVAGTANQAARELDAFSHGAFTYHLLEGLRGGAAEDGGSLISSEHLAWYVQRQMSRSDYGQDPQYGKCEGSTGIYCLKVEAEAAGAQPKAASKPDTRSARAVTPKPAIAPQPGKEIALPVQLEFLEATNGVNKSLLVNRSELCPSCKGKAPSDCAQCGGTGLVQSSTPYQVDYPAGVQDGERVTIPVPGNAGLGGAPAGAVYAVITVLPQPEAPIKGKAVKSGNPTPKKLVAPGGKAPRKTTQSPPDIKLPVGKRTAEGNQVDKLPIDKTSKAITVAGDGSGDYKLINQAIQSATSGATIYVKPGVYKESVNLTKDVFLVAQGPEGKVVIDGGSATALKIATAGGGVKGFSFRRSATGGSKPVNGAAVVVPTGAAKFEDCQFQADFAESRGDVSDGTGGIYDGVGVLVSGKAAPVFLQCSMTRCASGLALKDDAQGQYENCSFNKNSVGITLKGSANPAFLRCFAKNNNAEGVEIGGSARGTFTRCLFSGSVISGVTITDSGNPSFVGCNFEDVADGHGAFVSKSGAGTFEDCVFARNGNGLCVDMQATPQFLRCDFVDSIEAGIVVIDGGNPTVKNSKSYGSKTESGLLVKDSGVGRFEDCEFFRNHKSGIEVATKGNPTIVRSKSYDNQLNGFCAHDSAAGSISECTMSGNKGGDYSVSPNSTTKGVPKAGGFLKSLFG